MAMILTCVVVSKRRHSPLPPGPIDFGLRGVVISCRAVEPMDRIHQVSANMDSSPNTLDRGRTSPSSRNIARACTCGEASSAQ